jgi:hypothetical protein
MTSSTALEFHRTQLRQQGFTIFLNAARAEFLAEMAANVSRTREEDLVEGDESTHSWKEVPIDPPHELSDFVAGLDPSLVVERRPAKMTQWINVYDLGEFIGAHVDAGGDVQMMIPIELPLPGEGGDLWVRSKQCVLPVGAGDVLLFAAHRLRHGTTPVRSGRRISLNARIWLE